MTTTEINYKGTDYTCRIVTSNEGESLIIGGLELLTHLCLIQSPTNATASPTRKRSVSMKKSSFILPKVT